MHFFRRNIPTTSPTRQQAAAAAPATAGLGSTTDDLEAGPPGAPVPGLTFRSSSRSSSPCAGVSVRSPESRQDFYSPRAERSQQSFPGNALYGGTPSQSPTKPGSRYIPTLFYICTTSFGLCATRHNLQH